MGGQSGGLLDACQKNHKGFLARTRAATDKPLVVLTPSNS